MSQLLSVSKKLAGNPSDSPEFSVEVTGEKGERVKLADPRATRAMVALMDMNAVIGGAASHYGGPAAFAELMSAAHGFMLQESLAQGVEWHELFHFVNDAGHCENGLYALKANYKWAGLNIEKLKGFRSIDSVLTGHGESHLFPEGVLLSNGPLGSAFPQAQGLAMGESLRPRPRVTMVAISDGACMEGEAREAMAAVPGLAAQGKTGPFVMIISDNNTKLSGRIDKDAFSMEPSFKALTPLGWDVILLEDGHDLQKCYDALVEGTRRAKSNPQKPVAIHAKTIKGIGTKATAESSSGGHGFPLKTASDLPQFISEIYDGKSYPKVFTQWIEELIQMESEKKKLSKSGGTPTDKIQTGISLAMIKAKKEGLPVVSITSDLPGSTGVAGFRKEFPEYSFDVGVAEANMVSAAAGMSKVGCIPVVDTFAQFGVTKGALPLTMASLSQSPMIAVFSHTGFQDAADGASHQALSYFAMLSSIPHVECYALSCRDEAEALVYQAIQKFSKAVQNGSTPSSVVFFLGRENFPHNYGTNKFELGRSQVLLSNKKDKNTVIVGVGSTVPQALQAGKILSDKGMGVEVIHASSLTKLDRDTLLASCSSAQLVVTVEDHQKTSGFGQLLGAALLESGVKPGFICLGVEGQFGQSAYTAADLYKKHRIDAHAIVQSAEKYFS